MGMERTNTESHTSVLGHLEMEDKAAIVACCSLSQLDSEIRWDKTLNREALLERMGKVQEKRRKRNGRNKKGKKRTKVIEKRLILIRSVRFLSSLKLAKTYDTASKSINLPKCCGTDSKTQGKMDVRKE